MNPSSRARQRLTDAPGVSARAPHQIFERRRGHGVHLLHELRRAR
jgi:hypothetical protein